MVLAELTLQVSNGALGGAGGYLKKGTDSREVGQDIFNVHKLHLKLSSGFPQLFSRFRRIRWTCCFDPCVCVKVEQDIVAFCNIESRSGCVCMREEGCTPCVVCVLL